jgi:hypothetical protein
MDSLKNGHIVEVDTAITVSGNYLPGDSDSLQYLFCDEYGLCDSAWAILSVPQIIGVTAQQRTALRVFPNPFKNRLNWSSGQPTHLRIRDIQGRVVYETQLSGNAVPLPELPAGAYVAEFKTTDGHFRVQLMH